MPESRRRLDRSGRRNVTLRLHARYAHDSGDASGTADLVFASAPNWPGDAGSRAGCAGRDVAELAIAEARGGNVHLQGGL